MRDRDDELKLCNCAECNRELLGKECASRLESGFDVRSLPPIVNGRINGRPYCADCLRTAKLNRELNGWRAGGSRGNDNDPSQENAVRLLEGE